MGLGDLAQFVVDGGEQLVFVALPVGDRVQHRGDVDRLSHWGQYTRRPRALREPLGIRSTGRVRTRQRGPQRPDLQAQSGAEVTDAGHPSDGRASSSFTLLAAAGTPR